MLLQWLVDCSFWKVRWLVVEEPSNNIFILEYIFSFPYVSCYYKLDMVGISSCSSKRISCMDDNFIDLDGILTIKFFSYLMQSPS